MVKWTPCPVCIGGTDVDIVVHKHWGRLQEVILAVCGKWTHNQTLRSCVMQNVLIFMREHRQLVSALCLFSIHWELGRVGQDGDSQCHPHWAPCWLFRNLWVMSLWFCPLFYAESVLHRKDKLGQQFNESPVLSENPLQSAAVKQWRTFNASSHNEHLYFHWQTLRVRQHYGKIQR